MKYVLSIIFLGCMIHVAYAGTRQPPERITQAIPLETIRGLHQRPDGTWEGYAAMRVGDQVHHIRIEGAIVGDVLLWRRWRPFGSGVYIKSVSES